MLRGSGCRSEHEYTTCWARTCAFSIFADPVYNLRGGPPREPAKIQSPQHFLYYLLDSSIGKALDFLGSSETVSSSRKKRLEMKETSRLALLPDRVHFAPLSSHSPRVTAFFVSEGVCAVDVIWTGVACSAVKPRHWMPNRRGPDKLVCER